MSRKLSDIIKHSNIHITEVPEKENRERGAENLFEEMRAENLPNVGKEVDIQI